MGKIQSTIKRQSLARRLDLARVGKRVWLAGRDVGSIPADKVGRVLGGRPFQTVLSSTLLGGAGADASYIVQQMA